MTFDEMKELEGKDCIFDLACTSRSSYELRGHLVKVDTSDGEAQIRLSDGQMLYVWAIHRIREDD